MKSVIAPLTGNTKSVCDNCGLVRDVRPGVVCPSHDCTVRGIRTRAKNRDDAEIAYKLKRDRDTRKYGDERSVHDPIVGSPKAWGWI